MSDTDEQRDEIARLSAELRQLRGQLKAAPEPGVARRLTLSEILEAHLDTMRARATSGSSAVTLKENTHKTVQIEVTVRTGDDDDVLTVEDAAAKARATFDILRGFYPPPAVDPKGEK